MIRKIMSRRREMQEENNFLSRTNIFH